MDVWGPREHVKGVSSSACSFGVWNDTHYPCAVYLPSSSPSPEEGAGHIRMTPVCVWCVVSDLYFNHWGRLSLERTVSQDGKK